jgi:hypothetical protein
MNDSELDNLLHEMAVDRALSPDLKDGVRVEIARRAATVENSPPLRWSPALYAGAFAVAFAIGFVMMFAARGDSVRLSREETAAVLHLESFSLPPVFAGSAVAISSHVKER